MPEQDPERCFRIFAGSLHSVHIGKWVLLYSQTPSQILSVILGLFG